MRKNCFIPIYIFVIIVISFWYIFFHKISMSAPRVCSTVTPWPRVSTSLVLINVDAIQVTKETEETAEVRCLSFRHFDVIQGNGVLLNNFSKYWEFFFFWYLFFVVIVWVCVSVIFHYFRFMLSPFLGSPIWKIRIYLFAFDTIYLWYLKALTNAHTRKHTHIHNYRAHRPCAQYSKPLPLISNTPYPPQAIQNSIQINNNWKTALTRKLSSHSQSIIWKEVNMFVSRPFYKFLKCIECND